MKRIDIAQVLRQKAPALYAKMPGFVVRLVEWIVCQRQLNDILEHCDMHQGADFAVAMSEYLGVTYTVRGMENITADGRYMMVSNHPLGGFDGISYIALLGKKFAKFRVIVNDILYHIEPLRPVFLPVNTMGKQKRSDMQQLAEAYADTDTQLLSFPAGFCSRWIDGRVQDIEWRKSVVRQCVESRRDVVPMYFDGRNSRFFYFVEWLRRKLGMKFNIGLILLPWQMARYARGKHYEITIGKPIPWQTFGGDKTEIEWAQWLREQCYALKEK